MFSNAAFSFDHSILIEQTISLPSDRFVESESVFIETFIICKLMIIKQYFCSIFLIFYQLERFDKNTFVSCQNLILLILSPLIFETFHSSFRKTFFFSFVLSFSFACLHHRCWLYSSPSTNKTSATKKKCRPGCYYVKCISKWKQTHVLGLGDFFVYNILVLISIPSSASMIIISPVY